MLKVDLIEHPCLYSYTEPSIGWWSESPDEIGPGLLERLSCLELRVEAGGFCLEASRMLEDMVWALVQQGMGTPYLVKSSTFVTAKSRLKTYKGIFPRSWKNSPDDFVEEEIDHGSGSYLVGLARVAEADRNEGLHPNAGFLVISSHRSARTLWAAIGDSVKRAIAVQDWNDYVSLRELHVIPPIAMAGSAIVRFGGDQDGEFYNVALFLSSAARSAYASKFRQLGARDGPSDRPTT